MTHWTAAESLTVEHLERVRWTLALSQAYGRSMEDTAAFVQQFADAAGVPWEQAAGMLAGAYVDLYKPRFPPVVYEPER